MFTGAKAGHPKRNYLHFAWNKNETNYGKYQRRKWRRPSRQGVARRAEGAIWLRGWPGDEARVQCRLALESLDRARWKTQGHNGEGEVLRSASHAHRCVVNRVSMYIGCLLRPVWPSCLKRMRPCTLSCTYKKEH